LSLPVKNFENRLIWAYGEDYYGQEFEVVFLDPRFISDSSRSLLMFASRGVAT